MSVSAAARLLENMDMSVDPCENFFEYSCGGWLKTNVIPESSPMYSTFSTLRDKLDILVKGHTHTHTLSTRTRNHVKFCLRPRSSPLVLREDDREYKASSFGMRRAVDIAVAVGI